MCWNEGKADHPGFARMQEHSLPVQCSQSRQQRTGGQRLLAVLCWIGIGSNNNADFLVHSFSIATPSKPPCCPLVGSGRRGFAAIKKRSRCPTLQMKSSSAGTSRLRHLEANETLNLEKKTSVFDRIKKGFNYQNWRRLTHLIFWPPRMIQKFLNFVSRCRRGLFSIGRRQTTRSNNTNVGMKNETVTVSDAHFIEDSLLDHLKADDAAVEQRIPGHSTTTTILGDRWAVSNTNVDLSGQWSIIDSDAFRKEYDQYLSSLGQPFLVRSIAVSIIGRTLEETEQSDRGRCLFIRGTNARGVWERNLTASGADEHNDGVYAALSTPLVTADQELVLAEAWWEDLGTVHRSWLRGVTKYGGGDFESKRYLQNSEGDKTAKDSDVLVCESTFHPKRNSRKAARITWRFLRKPLL